MRRESDAAYRLRIGRLLLENGIPVGSDHPLLRAMGSPPLHLCDPGAACNLCATDPIPPGDPQ